MHFSDLAMNLKASEIRELLKLTTMPEVISFAGGLPAPELFPTEQLKKVDDAVLTKEGREALQYGTTEGYNPLRKQIAARMKQADRNGKLRKESQFVVGVPAREMNKADSDELILLQGIIDAWFEEDDGLVLVDYKTDRVKEGGENILLDRYQIQLFYYAKALAQITGKKVKEAVIYSLALQKEIPVPINL